MGYFSNGTEGIMYEDAYCMRCANWTERPGDPVDGCPVMDLHHFHNYDDCNNPESYLHVLIPRNKEGRNLPCKMFLSREDEP